MNKTEIFATKRDFLKRKDKTINGVSPTFAKYHPAWEKSNQTNEGCWNCFWCSFCVDCFRCKKCDYCANCSDCVNCANCESHKNASHFDRSHR